MDFMDDIKTSKRTFIIAEIGQNHQGDIFLAKEMIKIAKECGADCVKFQKTCLEEKFTKSALNAPYLGPNSWGKTYGEHKAFLEFVPEEYLDLQQYAENIGILFTASAMDEKSFEFLKSMEVPFIKIGSGDVNNFFLMEKAAQSNVPLVISTGMTNCSNIQEIYNLVSKYHKKFALLHCVSAYPTPYQDINLRVLSELRQKYPDIIIGYSGHELGMHISVSAVAMGAKIIERHFTLDKTQKGTDHKCSLDPNEFKQLVEQIRTLEIAMGQPTKMLQKSEEPCYEKLGKTLVYSRELPIGHKIGRDDLKVKVSTPKGIDAAKYRSILSKETICQVSADDPVLIEHFNL